MKFLTGCLLLVFLSSLYDNLYAQIKPSLIQGKVLAENHVPAEAATIVLLKYQDSSIVSSSITDKGGIFQFNNLPTGNYLLLVRSVGYIKSYTGPYKIVPGQSLSVPDIILSPDARQLKEVSVVSSKPEVEVRPGKIILNVQSSILADGNSVYDILRQSPGVRVDNSNNINIIGRQAALITIDGRPTNLTGDDLTGILKTMQANTIDRIEIITSGSAKYDASGGGIINIIMKKGKNVGANVAFTGSAGYGRYYKSNVGLVFNDRTNKFNIFGGYTFTDNKTFHDFTTDRMIDYDNMPSDYHVDYNSNEKINNNTFNLGTDYFISGSQTIGFLINGFIEEDNYTKDNNLKIFNQSVLDSSIAAASDLNRHITKVNYNLNYTDKLGKTGKALSADFDYHVYNRASAENITNKFYNSSGNIFHPDSLLQNISPSNIRNWLGKVDFTDPFSKTSKLETGIKYSKTISDNNQMFKSLTNGRYQNDPIFTNDFNYNENVNAAYVNFENQLDKFEITTSLRAEQTISSGNSATLNQIVKNNYIDLFPHALITYKYDERNIFSISYNRGIQRPAYQQLNPFYYYIDLYDYSAGNQYLKPEYSNSIELSYNYNRTFLATIYSTITGNAYDFQFYEQNDTTKVNTSLHENLGTVYTYGLRINTPVVFTSWWNADIFLDAAYQRYVTYPQYGYFNKGSQDIIFTITQHFVISKTVSVQLVAHYETPSLYGITEFRSYYFADAAISKQLFNKRGSLTLSGKDIFNTLRDRDFISYENLNMTTIDKRESQVFRLTFTYRFGKTTVKAAGVHHAGNEEEQDRTKEAN